ncbi:uncharacterized protein LOC116263299 [Nymphaea colorata]|nr:uncharacterized protein LOC116263299 [Nymphaea colorata]
MEQSDRKEEHILDLESGLAYSAEQNSKVTLSDNGQSNKAPVKVWSGFVKLDGSVKGIDAVVFCNNATNAPNIQVENPELFTTKKLGEAKPHSMEKGHGKEKSRKPSNKKPPRPPRPPKARTLDAADQKLVQQITELAMLKKARVERMKALKRMKANKGSSSNGSLLAMIITILFCLVVLLEGAFPQNSSGVKFQGSPVPAMARGPALISVQFNNNDSVGSTAFPASPSGIILQRSGAGIDESS